MCKLKESDRLGGPLGSVICAYYGGTAWGFLLQIEELNRANRRNGIETKVLEKEQTPPPGSVFLREVDPAPGVTKFSPRPVVEGEIIVIDIPLVRAIMKDKRDGNRKREFAGTIAAMVWRGNSWRDRSGKVHNNPY